MNPFCLLGLSTKRGRLVRLVLTSFSSSSSSSSASFFSSSIVGVLQVKESKAFRPSSGMFFLNSLVLLRLASFVTEPRPLKMLSSEYAWLGSLRRCSFCSIRRRRLLSFVSMLSWEDVLQLVVSRLLKAARRSGDSMSREWVRWSKPSCLRSMLRMVAALCSLSWTSTLSRRLVSRSSARTLAFHSAA